MKKLLILLAGILFITVYSCDENLAEVDENGLTQEINDLVPQYIIEEMINLGMIINGGPSPPSIEGTYLASPFILINSNIDHDQLGFQFTDYEVTFSDQDDNDLSIVVDYLTGPESGEGIGSYIVGEGNAFTVFVEVTSTDGNTFVTFTNVISGTLVEDGIEDLHYSNFMINDNGDPDSVWIDNGQGRLIIDQDGFSPRL